MSPGRSGLSSIVLATQTARLRPAFRRCFPSSAFQAAPDQSKSSSTEAFDTNFFARNKIPALIFPHIHSSIALIPEMAKVESQVRGHRRPENRPPSVNTQAAVLTHTSPSRLSRSVEQRGTPARRTYSSRDRRFAASQPAWTMEATPAQRSGVGRTPLRRLQHLPQPHFEALRPLTIRSTPRETYIAAAQQSADVFDSNCEPPAPLPLLVLDLNGTLVWRSGGRRSQSSIVRRPYLSSFLAYCLGVEDISYGHRLDSDEAAANRRRAEWTQARQRLSSPFQNLSFASKPHGSHFWRMAGETASSDEHNDPTDSQAACRLLVWSSAMPHNVDTMVEAILHPQQAAQLVRCWGRDTLVPRRFFSSKFPSIKDLEIVWNAVNLVLHDLPSEDAAQGESRTQADYRDRHDYCEPDERWHGDEVSEAEEDTILDGVSASLRTSMAVAKAVSLPERQADGSWRPGAGYGPHNTLLLDDTPEKAALQPFNHLRIPEFAAKAASIAKEERENARMAGKAVCDHFPSPELDTVLLQTVGVVEHARRQKNVAAWIHSKGLGWFAGLEQGKVQDAKKQDSTSLAEAEEVEPDVGQAREGKDSDLAPRLDMPTMHRTAKFWAQEGINALRRRNIPIVI